MVLLHPEIVRRSVGSRTSFRLATAIVFACASLLTTGSAWGDAWLIVKLTRTGDGALPQYLGLYRTFPIQRRLRHKELDADLVMVPLIPGSYLLEHVCSTKGFPRDPLRRYLNYTPLLVRADTVNYVGDFDIRGDELGIAVRPATIAEACERFPGVMKDARLSIMHPSGVGGIVESPCTKLGSDDFPAGLGEAEAAGE
jgi:hypothetical protein